MKARAGLGPWNIAGSGPGQRGTLGLTGQMDTRAFRGLGEGGMGYFTAVFLEARQTLLKPVSNHVSPCSSASQDTPLPADKVRLPHPSSHRLSQLTF